MEEAVGDLQFARSVNDDADSIDGDMGNVVGVNNQENRDEDVIGVQQLESNDIEQQGGRDDDICNIGVERSGDSDIVEVPKDEFVSSA